ncbi:sulfatase family protein [Algoriphagus aquimarinus]|uniref:Arylsulfatase A n=1 Tax=Algoriphagus aquimarinus TaxID=237018 RepID=A0A1I0ZPR7_9BACT|nr:arylsulfatase [Algoriphagus aquimarinus]SFB27655.1 Arylsulfatase A [Algoriphagus aquimarinus]
MKFFKINFKSILAIAFFGIAAFSFAKKNEMKEKKSTPNIIIILADDLGFGDPEVYNPDSKIPTPNINALAKSGIRFTDAHSPSAVCTPTRYGLLTGQYSWRTALENGVLLYWDKPLIDQNRQTIATMLKESGYNTAAIGKWHLGWLWSDKQGKYVNDTLNVMPHNEKIRQPLADKIDFHQALGGGPTTLGFDYYFGDDVPNYAPYSFFENDRVLQIPDMIKPDSIYGNPGPMSSGWDLRAVMPKITQKAEEYIEEQADSNNQFFLYFALTAPHTPIAPAGEFQGKTKIGPYGDYVHQVDYTVGQIVKALKKSGQLENTLIIFTSDNGSPQRDGTEMSGAIGSVKATGHDPSKPYRGTKADIFEGGHRVPFIVSWPAAIKNDQVNSQLFGLNDVISTLAGITGNKEKSSQFEDSRDFSSVFLGKSDKPVREDIINHSSKGSFAIRKGDWKLIMAEGSGGWTNVAPAAKGEKLPSIQLYNLKTDPQELNNLQAEYPELVKEMSAKLEKYKSQGYSNPDFSK